MIKVQPWIGPWKQGPICVMLRKIRWQTYNKLARFQPGTACLYLKISLLSFINKALKIQPSIHWGRLPYPTPPPPGASCSINCIYHLVNVLFKFSISFATEVEKKNRPSHGQCFNRGLRSTKDLKRASGHLSLSTNNVRDLKSLLLSWKTCILVHLNAWKV